MADNWDLSQYAQNIKKKWSPNTTAYVPGMDSYNSPSGNVRVDIVTPGGVKDQAGQAATAGSADGGFDMQGYLDMLRGGSPSGGSPSGGGGSSAPPPPDYSGMTPWMQAAKPQAYQYQNLSLPEYQQYQPRAWDGSMYDTARSGVATGIADARAMGNTAFDRTQQEYANWQNAYAGGPRATNPGVDPRLAASMRAFGNAGAAQNQQAQYEAGQADNVMSAFYDLLGRADESYRQGLMRATEGDRMQMDQRLGAEERMLGLGVDMAKARARQLYDQEVWTLGKEAADKNFEMRVTEAVANNQGANQAAQSNTQMGNQWNSDMLNMVLQMIGSGGTGIPTDPGQVMY